MNVWIERFHQYVSDVFPHREGGIRWQSPRSSRPSQERDWFIDRCAENRLSLFVFHQRKLRNDGRVLHIFVGAGHVQFVRTEACSGSWRIRLNRVAFVKQTFVEQALQQPPNRFDVLVIVGNIWIFHIHPIAHLAGKVVPDAGKLHYILAACLVVLFDGEFFTDVFLGDAEVFLHA